MEARIVTVYCIVDDILKHIGFSDDLQATISTSEIITIAITAAMFFGGNHIVSMSYFKDSKLIKHSISKSQYNKRIHRIDGSIWELIFHTLSKIFQAKNNSTFYAIDSFPVEVCHNIRIARSKIYKDELYRGRCASKRVFFYGIKVHMIVTASGEPVEFILAPGSLSDSMVFKNFEIDLPKKSSLVADAGYTDYNYEEVVHDGADINFFCARKSNSKRPHNIWIETLIEQYRKIIETSFSCINRLFPKKIHAVTSKGFELKVICFIFAYSFNCL